jgi:hypothetical protein
MMMMMMMTMTMMMIMIMIMNCIVGNTVVYSFFDGPGLDCI